MYSLETFVELLLSSRPWGEKDERESPAFSNLHATQEDSSTKGMRGHTVIKFQFYLPVPQNRQCSRNPIQNSYLETSVIGEDL